jgi:hypothetical protein
MMTTMTVFYNLLESKGVDQKKCRGLAIFSLLDDATHNTILSSPTVMMRGSGTNENSQTIMYKTYPQPTSGWVVCMQHLLLLDKLLLFLLFLLLFFLLKILERHTRRGMVDASPLLRIVLSVFCSDKSQEKKLLEYLSNAAPPSILLARSMS